LSKARVGERLTSSDFFGESRGDLFIYLRFLPDFGELISLLSGTPFTVFNWQLDIK